MQHLELDSLNRKVKSYQEDEACRRGRQVAIQDEADRARRALEKAHVQKVLQVFNHTYFLTIVVLSC